MTQDGTLTYKIIGGDHKEYGPATAEEVRQWILDGRASGHTLGQLVGSGEWKTLATFPEFDEDLKAQARHFGSALTQEAPPAGATPPDLPVAAQPDLRVGHCLAGSARLFIGNFGLLVPCMPMCLLSFARDSIPLMGPVLQWFLHGVLYGGLYLLLLKRIRGQPTGISEVFAGFGPQFLQLSMAGFLISLLSGIGFLVCFFPGLYLTVAWIFAIPAAADRGLEFWPAMELSRRTATRVWFKVAVLLLIAFLPVLLAHLYTQVKIFSITYPAFSEMLRAGQSFDMKKLQELLEQVGKVLMPLQLINNLVLLFNLPFAAGAVAYAYEDLFGARSTRQG